jgi:hypothetical protein
MGVSHLYPHPRLAGLGVALALVASGSLAVAAPAPAARHRQAVTVNTGGLRLMKTGQTARAAQHFRDAIALDPDYALAHYNLACASSILRDVPAAVAELEWLASRGDDAVAKARIDKAQTDADLDFVSVLPRVRTLLSESPFSTERALSWLAERTGTWSAELPMSDCASRSYTFQFAGDGQLQLTIRESCAGEPVRARTWDGRLTLQDDGTLDVAVDWPQWPKQVRMTLAACPGLDDVAGSCFTLSNDKVDLGPFHRGAAGTSPLTHKSRDFALSTGK